MAETIYEEIDETWDSVSAKLSLPRPPESRFTSVLDDIDAENRAIAEANLQPWMAILEQGIQWLGSLQVFLEGSASRGEGNDQLRVQAALVGTACAHATGVRRLALSGLDSSAKVVLRSLVEAVHLAIIMLTDSNLNGDFLKSQSSTEASALWNRQLRPQRIVEKLDAIETNLGLDLEIREDLKKTRESMMRWTSQFVHPSYVSAVVTARPRTMADPAYHQIGSLGVVSVTTISTLDTANKALWYFASVGGYLLFRDQRGWRFLRDPETVINQIALLGRDVLIELVMRHWDDIDDAVDSLAPPD